MPKDLKKAAGKLILKKDKVVADKGLKAAAGRLYAKTEHSNRGRVDGKGNPVKTLDFGALTQSGLKAAEVVGKVLEKGKE